MATSIRLPDTLKARAAAHADGLGISLNALIAVALSDYLDARTLGTVAGAIPEPMPEPEPAAADPIAQGEERTAEPALNVSPARKPGRNAPCPCGSGRKYKVCCGRG